MGVWEKVYLAFQTWAIPLLHCLELQRRMEICWEYCRDSASHTLARKQNAAPKIEISGEHLGFYLPN